MIKEVSGDILLTSAQAIAHGIAPGDHFDSGLALSLREVYPSMVKDFRHYCKLHNPEPGTVWIWGSAEGIKIINLLTQEPAKGNGHPGEATLQHVGHALKALAKLVEKEKLTSLAVPKLATGVGKLQWADVKPLLEKHLGDLHIPVYVYSTYVKGQKAEG
ncbi:MAG: macro domain-containing protein [Saprospiraceae bacterium]|nr:macro domain-containing protein [Saprospiraceae bacterium]